MDESLEVLFISGGYDGYRPPFSNSANSGYGQTQFSTPRDYSNCSYQRVSSTFDTINKFLSLPFEY